jgi:hypothetical protein
VNRTIRCWGLHAPIGFVVVLLFLFAAPQAQAQRRFFAHPRATPGVSKPAAGAAEEELDEIRPDVDANGQRRQSTTEPAGRTRDTVVVPVDAEKMPSLVKWQAVTQMLYNIAIATAAVHAF